jgi:hypothetical protein
VAIGITRANVQFGDPPFGESTTQYADCILKRVCTAISEHHKTDVSCSYAQPNSSSQQQPHALQAGQRFLLPTLISEPGPLHDCKGHSQTSNIAFGNGVHAPRTMSTQDVSLDAWPQQEAEHANNSVRKDVGDALPTSSTSTPSQPLPHCGIQREASPDEDVWAFVTQQANSLNPQKNVHLSGPLGTQEPLHFPPVLQALCSQQNSNFRKSIMLPTRHRNTAKRTFQTRFFEVFVSEHHGSYLQLMFVCFPPCFQLLCI